MLRKTGLIILILGFMIAIGLGVKAHYTLHDCAKAHLFFTENPEITCDIDGKQFTHTKVTKNGKTLVDFWHEQPRIPKFTITAKSHGFGWAYIKLSGNVDGNPFGDANNWADSEKLGIWSPMLPFGLMPGEESLKHEEEGHFNSNPKVYNWKSKGTVKLVPWVWEWSSALLVIPTGTWKPAVNEENTELNADSNGSWTVERNWSVEGSGSIQIPDNDEENAEENSEEQEQATRPDSPSFTLTPNRYAILLRWSDANDGGSPITDYQYQKKSSRSNGNYWSSWSSWTSAGTGNSTWINGLSRGVTYAVRMRSVNAVGTSSASGIQTTRTTE